MLLQLLFLSVIATICKTTIPATEEYPHQAVLGLEGKMILYWKFDETTITFEVIKYSNKKLKTFYFSLLIICKAWF